MMFCNVFVVDDQDLLAIRSVVASALAAPQLQSKGKNPPSSALARVVEHTSYGWYDRYDPSNRNMVALLDADVVVLDYEIRCEDGEFDYAPWDSIASYLCGAAEASACRLIVLKTAYKDVSVPKEFKPYLGRRGLSPWIRDAFGGDDKETWQAKLGGHVREWIRHGGAAERYRRRVTERRVNAPGAQAILEASLGMASIQARQAPTIGSFAQLGSLVANSRTKVPATQRIAWGLSETRRPPSGSWVVACEMSGYDGFSEVNEMLPMETHERFSAFRVAVVEGPGHEAQAASFVSKTLAPWGIEVETLSLNTLLQGAAACKPSDLLILLFSSDGQEEHVSALNDRFLTFHANQVRSSVVLLASCRSAVLHDQLQRRLGAASVSNYGFPSIEGSRRWATMFAWALAASGDSRFATAYCAKEFALWDEEGHWRSAWRIVLPAMM